MIDWDTDSSLALGEPPLAGPRGSFPSLVLVELGVSERVELAHSSAASPAFVASLRALWSNETRCGRVADGWGRASADLCGLLGGLGWRVAAGCGRRGGLGRRGNLQHHLRRPLQHEAEGFRNLKKQPRPISKGMDGGLTVRPLGQIGEGAEEVGVGEGPLPVEGGRGDGDLVREAARRRRLRRPAFPLQAVGRRGEEGGGGGGLLRPVPQRLHQGVHLGGDAEEEGVVEGARELRLVPPLADAAEHPPSWAIPEEGTKGLQEGGAEVVEEGALVGGEGALGAEGGDDASVGVRFYNQTDGSLQWQKRPAHP